MEQGIQKKLGMGFWLIVFLAIALRLFAYLKNPSFWFDESALAYNIISLKYIDLLGILHLQQVAPPLFLILSKWMASVFGVSELTLRLVPFIFGCLSIIPFYFVVKHIFERSVTINFAMLLFAINPKLIYYGTEFKPYILDVFFTLLIFLIFLKMDLKKWDLKKIFITGFVLTFSVWFSFVSTIACLVGLVSNLIEQKEYKKWFVLISPMVLNYSLFLAYYLNVSGFYRDFMLRFFRNDFNQYSLPLGYLFNNEFSLALIILSITIIVGMLYFLMEKKTFEIAFMVWCFILTILLSHAHLYPAYQRFTLFLLPFLIIIVSMTFNLLIEKKNVQSRLVLLIIFASLIPTSITIKDSESRELTNYFLKNIKPNELVVIDKLAFPDFLYYTYGIKMTNKIVVPFKSVKGKIMYKSGTFFEFPDYPKFWFYATRAKGFDKYVIKEGKFETIEGYKILKKMITPNGFVMRLSKD